MEENNLSVREVRLIDSRKKSDAQANEVAIARNAVEGRSFWRGVLNKKNAA